MEDLGPGAGRLHTSHDEALQPQRISSDDPDDL